MPGYVFPIIFFIIINSGISVASKEKFGTTLPFTFIMSSVVIYVSQYVFHTFNVGFVILIILALLVIPYLLIYIWKGSGRSGADYITDNVLSTGFITFLMIAGIFLIIDFGSTFGKWDELSHWGVMIKEMLRLDLFYSVDASTLSWHKEYPPMIQCFELLWVKLCGAYSETAMRMSIHVLMFVLPVAWIADNIDILAIKFDKSFDNNKSNNNGVSSKICDSFMILLLILTLIIMINSFDGENVFITIYQDFCYPMFYIYAMLLVLTGSVWKNSFAAVSFVTTLSGLIMTKQMGIAFYGILMWTLIGSILIEKDNSDSKVSIRKSLVIIITSIVIPALIYMSWSRYTKALGLVGQFDLSGITVSGVVNDLLGNGSSEAYEISRIYFGYIFSRSIFVGAAWITYFGVFVFTIILIVGLGLVFKDEFKRLMLLCSSCIIGTLGYAFTMLILYMYCYQNEAPAVCYERYMGTYVLSELILILLVVLMILRDKYIFGKISYNNAILICLILVTVVLADKSNLMNLRPAIMKSTDKAEKYSRFADELSEYAEAGSTVLIIDDDQGYCRNYIHYYLNDRFIDIRFPDIYNADFSNEEFTEYFLACVAEDDYLYMVNINDDLKALLGQYTDEGELESKGIYSISVGSDGELALDLLQQ